MSLTIQQWHNRYKQQAEWTKSLRFHVYEQIEINKAQRILDVGCGTGVLIQEISLATSGDYIGVDLDTKPLKIAKTMIDDAKVTAGNALQLPFLSGSFDVCLCHFVLLWINDPLLALREMVRVTHPGGFVLVLAEPDYGGRIDFPVELSIIGQWQINAIRDQGANPLIGRELRSLCNLAGLLNVEVGVLGGQWRVADNSSVDEQEWDVITSDLNDNNEFMEAYNELKIIDQSSRANNQRVLFVPTFYAIGEVIT